MQSKKIKVLVIDDMALVRDILSHALATDPNIEVVGTASSAQRAFELIPKLQPHVLTLDVEMPGMNGIDFLQRLMPQNPLPVVMVSSLTQRGQKVTLDALAAGAVDFVSKPASDIDRGLRNLIAELCAKIKMAATANVSNLGKMSPVTSALSRLPSASVPPSQHPRIIAIGASTGGTEAIKDVITRLPKEIPGIVIVQHMPAGFTRMFAERMDSLCELEVKEASDGDEVIPGRVLIAPGGFHMELLRLGNIYRVRVHSGPLINGHCPSVEVLMLSVAKQAKGNAMGIMLTGMGGDGAMGLKAMRDAGAYTIAQDETTSVVFGMPKVAWEKGGVKRMLPLPQIPGNIMQWVAHRDSIM